MTVSKTRHNAFAANKKDKFYFSLKKEDLKLLDPQKTSSTLLLEKLKRNRKPMKMSKMLRKRKMMTCQKKTRKSL